MVHIKLQNEEIEISMDEKGKNEEDLLKELNRVLCFTIIIYKRRIEKLQKSRMTKYDEAIINQKIKKSIAMIPMDEVREYLQETRD